MNGTYSIGVLCNELTRNFQSPLYKATKYWGQKLGVNLYFYEGKQLFGRKYSDLQHNITFQLAKNADHDGYIFHPIFMHIPHQQIINWCKAFDNKPKVSINKRILDYASCVKVDNYRGMKSLLDHLYREHQYLNIAFVYGVENNDESRDRYRAYCDFMNNKQRWNEENVFHGGFESDSGINAIKTIIDSGKPYDAIVFSNDESALAAIDYINNSAPEYKGRFAITGFDDSPHGQFSKPALTSVSQPFDDLARTSLETIIKMIENDGRVMQDRLLPTKLAIRESCGCKNKEIFDTSSLRLYTSPYSVNENIESFGREEFYDKLTKALDPTSITHCDIVLYDKPVTFEAEPTFPAQSKLHFAYHNNQRVDLTKAIHFQTETLLPEGFAAKTENTNAVVQSLFYCDDHFGYVIFDGTHAKEIDMEEVRAAISSNLHTIILFEGLAQALNEKNQALDKVQLLNKQLSTANNKLEIASRTDTLTGTFNRRGFYQAIEECLSDNRLNMPITLFYCDLDDLKFINDDLGHKCGDIAIVKAAEILKDSFRREDIIGRMGGDEFVVFTSGCSESDIELITQRIGTRSEEFSRNNDEGIHFSLSMGHKSINSNAMAQIEKGIQLADEALCRKKRSKKIKTQPAASK